MKCAAQRTGEMGMKLDLLGLFGGAVKELPFEITMDADGLSPDIIGGSITAKGEARNRAGYVVITAETVLDAKAVCARCGGVLIPAYPLTPRTR